MTHLVVVEATNLIQSGDIVRAEALLTALVETEGDHALVEVLDDIPAKDLLLQSPNLSLAMKHSPTTFQIAQKK